MIRAILRAQWLSMRTLRVGTRVSGTIFSLLTGLMFYGFWVIVALGAEEYFSVADNNEIFKIALPMALALVMLYWQGAPGVSARLCALLYLKKIIVYPIPRGRPVVVENL